jgi:hypothetical protein
MGGDTERSQQQTTTTTGGEGTHATGGVSGALSAGPHKVTATWLNIRSEPVIKKGNVITAVPHGTALNVSGAAQNGFYAVTYGSVHGFASGHYLEGSATGSGMAAVHRIIQQPTPPTPTATPTPGAAAVQTPLEPVGEVQHATEIVPPEQQAAPAPTVHVVPPDIDDTQAATGQHVADGMKKLNGGQEPVQIGDNWVYLTAGISYTYNFRRDLLLAQSAAKGQDLSPDAMAARAVLAKCPIKAWDDDLRMGYANPDYFERTGFMSWTLKPGKSAAAAVKAFLHGITIGECNTTMKALEWDAARAAMGDAAFDKAYEEGFVISPEASPPVITETEGAKAAQAGKGSGTLGNRPAQVGDWYYFCNHPKYLLKHPGGAWQGENAILSRVDKGVQYWSGLGADDKTEDSMMDEMVEAYNGDRDEDDQREIDEQTKNNGGKIPDELDPTKRIFPDKITKQDILTAPPFTYGGQTRTGGFLAYVGMHTDMAVIDKGRNR